MKLPKILQIISADLEKQNAKAIIVGGSVRDYFLELVLQINMFNYVGHTTVIIIPLTTQLIDDVHPLRYRIN